MPEEIGKDKYKEGDREQEAFGGYFKCKYEF